MADVSELYEFFVDGVYYTFTPKLLPVVFSGRTYVPTSVKRDPLVLSGDVLKNTINIQFIFTNSFARSVLANFPENVLTIVIYRNNGFYWGGRVNSATASGALITLTCTSIYTKTARPMITRKVQIPCPYILFSPACKADKNLFSQTVTINSVNSAGNLITVTGISQADNYFLDGQAVWNGQYRNLTKQTGGNLRISQPFVGTPTGTMVLYAGCDKKETTCQTKFNNLINHGGFRRLPKESPYNAQGIYK